MTGSVLTWFQYAGAWGTVLCLCCSEDIYSGTAYGDSDYTVEIAVMHVLNRIL